MKNIFILPSTSILQAMKKLSNTNTKCLIVAGINRQFHGTLNDGDLRRGLLKGMTGQDSIVKIYQKKPTFLYENNVSSKNFARNLMKKNMLTILPVLNKKKIVTNYFTWNELFKEKEKNDNLKNINIVIMAGGEGTRLSPFTKILPKPLMPYNNRPIIQHIIEKFLNFGAKKFYVSVNYKSSLMKSYFNEIKPQYNLNFLKENEPLGTVGGLQLHKKKLYKKDIFLSYCDILINADFSEVYNFHIQNNNDLTVVVSAKKYKIPYGICNIDKKGNLKTMIEKPSTKFFVNTGLYILKPKILNLIPEKKFFHMNQLIDKVIKKKMKVSVYPVRDEDWIDTGNLSNYTNEGIKSSLNTL